MAFFVRCTSRIFRLSQAIWLLLLAARFSARGAESEFVSQTWTAENGLPDNSVGALAQTPDGYLWVATQSSLARFDGFEFTREPLGETAAVTSRLIRAMCCDQRGSIWAALESGPVLCFSGGGVTTVPIANATTRDWASSICEDRAGTIWLAYQRGSVCRIENGKASFLSRRDGIPEKSRPCLCADRDGTIWLSEGNEVGNFRQGKFVTLTQAFRAPMAICPSREGGIWIADPDGLRTYREENGAGAEHAFPSGTRVRDISVVFEDHSGHVWIGNFGGGLYCWDGSEMSAVQTPTDDIFAITEDREGNLWVGAEGGGLTRFRPRRARLLSVEQGLPSSGAHSIAADGSGGVWIVSRDGEVVHQPAVGALVRLPRPPWNASCVMAGAAGETWVGTGNLGLFALRDGTYTPIGEGTALGTDSVRALFKTSDGELLISGQTSSVHRLRGKDLRTYELPDRRDYVRAFAEDSRRDLWAGTLGGRLLRLRKDRLEDLTPRAFPAGASIRTLISREKGGLWIGFAKHGIGRLWEGEFVRAGTEEGLWSDAVSQVLEDSQGRLWMGGDRGYFHLFLSDFDALAAGKTKKIRSELFGRGDGIPPVQASFGHFPSAATLPTGELAFGTSAGALIVNPKAIPSKGSEPPVYLTSIEIDGTERKPQQPERN